MWRCRACNGVFLTPAIAEYVFYANSNTRGVVFAHQIPKMERRARLYARRKKRMLRDLTVAAVVVLALLAVGYWATYMRDTEDGSALAQRSVENTPHTPPSPPPTLPPFVPHTPPAPPPTPLPVVPPTPPSPPPTPLPFVIPTPLSELPPNLRHLEGV